MPTAVIIGASSGLGREIALTYIRRGYRIGVAARRIERLDALVGEAPERVVAGIVDVTADDAPARLESLIHALGAPVDIFINCAGIGFANPMLDPKADIDTVKTNCLGFTRVTDFMFNYFADNSLKGQIVAISSVAGTRGIGMAASYSASKRFQSEYLTALSQLAHQRRLPVTITDIKPGFVDTPLLDAHTKYPMMMNTRRATALIVKAIDRRRSRIIDLRWAMVVALWRCVPGFVWRRMRLRLSATDNKN